MPTPPVVYIFRSTDKKAIGYSVDRNATNLPPNFTNSEMSHSVLTSGTAWLRIPANVRAEIAAKGYFVVENIVTLKIVVPRIPPLDDPYWSNGAYCPIEFADQIFPWWER